jgi:hypothetical protein
MTRTARFQFHLSSLFVAITLACIIFALISDWGYGGFVERALAAISFAAIFSPFLDLFFWWRENIETFYGPQNTRKKLSR